MITIVVGTNRPDSTSEQVAFYYQSLLTAHEAESQIINLVDLPHDFAFSALYKNSGKNAKFNLLRQSILEAERYVFIVPEYNGSFPGVLKTFIDGMPYPSPFENKRIALVGLSSGVQGGALALSHLTDIFSYLNGNVLGTRVKLIQVEKNMEDGKVTNALYNQLLNSQIERFLKY